MEKILKMEITLQALEEICKVEGDFLVRFISPHPRDFSDEVIEL